MNASITINIVNDVVNIQVSGTQATLTNIDTPIPVTPPTTDGTWSPIDEITQIAANAEAEAIAIEAQATAAVTAQAATDEEADGTDPKPVEP